MGQVCNCFAGLVHRRQEHSEASEPLRPQGQVAQAAQPVAAAAPAAADASAGSASAPHRAGDGQRPKKPAPLAGDSEGSSSDEDGEFHPVAELGPDGLPSVGSAGHDKGDCKRCCFFPKGRCTNGHDCRFCHFDHDKRKRMKKKKKKGSEAQTPSSNAGSLAVSAMATPGGTLAGGMSITPQMLTPLGYAGTPLAHGVPTTPLSPSMPPPAPPALAGFQTMEPPPPPADAPYMAPSAATEGEPSSAPPAAPAAASAVPTASPAELTSITGTPAKYTGKPVTLADLTAADKADTEKLPLWPAPEASAAAAAQPLAAPGAVPGWPGYWNPYAMHPQWAAAAYPGMPPGQPAYPPNMYSAVASPQSKAAQAPATALGLDQPPKASAPVPGILPAQPRPTLPDGMEKDSPRSVVLTLCGAWGALKTPTKEQEGAEALKEGPGLATKPASSPEATAAPLSRQSLLGLRAKPGKKTPEELKSLRVFAVQ